MSTPGHISWPIFDDLIFAQFPLNEVDTYSVLTSADSSFESRDFYLDQIKEQILLDALKVNCEQGLFDWVSHYGFPVKCWKDNPVSTAALPVIDALLAFDTVRFLKRFYEALWSGIGFEKYGVIWSESVFSQSKWDQHRRLVYPEAAVQNGRKSLAKWLEHGTMGDFRGLTFVPEVDGDWLGFHGYVGLSDDLHISLHFSPMPSFPAGAMCHHVPKITSKAARYEYLRSTAFKVIEDLLNALLADLQPNISVGEAAAVKISISPATPWQAVKLALAEGLSDTKLKTCPICNVTFNPKRRRTEHPTDATCRKAIYRRNKRIK